MVEVVEPGILKRPEAVESRKPNLNELHHLVLIRFLGLESADYSPQLIIGR